LEVYEEMEAQMMEISDEKLFSCGSDPGRISAGISPVNRIQIGSLLGSLQGT
jgi:hypothetical protein